MVEADPEGGPSPPAVPAPAGGTLTGARLRQALESALAELRRWCPQVNALNVFPVADHDTGTNLCATLAAAVEAARAAGEEAARTGEGIHLGFAAAAAARGAFWGARGNSGAILAEYLHGLSEAWSGLREAGGPQVAQALQAAARAARAAVEAPVEGTLLTVADAAAEAARAAVPPGQEGTPPATAAEVLRRAASAARAAWMQTPRMLPVLRRAGVVDAGAAGLVTLLEAMASAVEEVPTPPLSPPAPLTRPRPTAAPEAVPAPAIPVPGPARYCTEVWLQAGPVPASRVRRALQRLGDSVVVAERDGLLHLHLHTDAPQRVLSRAWRWGQVEQLRAVRLPEAACRAMRYEERCPIQASPDDGPFPPAEQG